MADPSSLLGPVDALRPYVEYVVLALVLLNMVTRLIAHRTHRRQAQRGAEAVTRHPAHVLSGILLVLGAFYYTTVHHHAGMVLAMLALGVIITDFFEFEARKVEARSERTLERPKAALAASVLVLGYALFQSLFFIVEPIFSSII
jgi:ABC-type xylose transport system permease subunit